MSLFTHLADVAIDNGGKMWRLIMAVELGFMATIASVAWILGYRIVKMQRKTNQLISIIVGMMFALCAGSSVAQKAVTDPLQIKLVRSKVVQDKGREVMESAATAKPGEVLEEVATYTNTSKTSLKNLEATLPVPPNTELVMASIKPAAAKASTDGKTFSTMPLMRKVKQASGVEVETPVPLSEYRYIRWYPGELAPDKPLAFSARFKVADSPVVPTTAVK